MATTLKKLCTRNDNPFKLQLVAGQDSSRNVITWVYAFEDQSMIRYLHGSDLVVTTGLQQSKDPGWLMSVVEKISDHKAAGLVVNTGMFVQEIPQDVIDYCNEHDFPLLTMPWEMHTTELIQTFCTEIINERQAYIRHDQALRDAVLSRENKEEYTEILEQYYDVNGSFLCMMIYSKLPEGQDYSNWDKLELRFVNEIRRLKTRVGEPLKKFKLGLVRYDNYELLCLNCCPDKLIPVLQDTVHTVYKDYIDRGIFFAGVGSNEQGLENISHSFFRARTALRMAQYQSKPFIQFEEMGFNQILFSVRDEGVLKSYANQILAPLDAYDEKGHESKKLLKAYIENDRSLERTAEELYIHRNTVNYQVQKLKQLLNNPLKSVEDLFPFQVALAIRDMETKG